ncbi:MAG: hypothetical protein LKF01_00160 [Lactobacillus sp.]|jgi:hypothetical protein|nr:hypothetical protein [Lactobacillus sp.]MCH4067956.1 hypothetical protein [Lactobacillus sp.]MCI1303605.1 hypothetical protein [Lactobacillus sp.]MCI1329886.1 hypothetical protein [Lactobacillus sp.]MCI1399486.1 hypothetical protein [Lactobacillus sp.]
MDYKRMKKTLFLEKGVLPEKIDSMNYYDLLDVLNVPENDLSDPGAENAYDNVDWAD